MYATGCLDAETSIPALLNGEHSILTVPVTINNLMPGLCVLPDPKEPVGMAGYLSWLFPRCKISPKLNGTAPHFGDEMFALVLFVCYLDGGCEDIVVDVYNTEQQCLHSMSDQRIRQGGCFPIEDL
ncbi:protein [Escherichia coli]|uniref:Protein n=1 Tax=Escherichia coli TaxID=562 RepID=A0A377B9R7_ECOLX|nr:protein [Escherichia coli]